MPASLHSFRNYQATVSQWLSSAGDIKPVVISRNDLLAELSKKRSDQAIRNKELKARMEESIAKVEELLHKSRP